eukprot:scaffold78012_cov29-Tisochrysis_lutea.AAC.1
MSIRVYLLVAAKQQHKKWTMSLPLHHCHIRGSRSLRPMAYRKSSCESKGNYIAPDAPKKKPESGGGRGRGGRCDMPRLDESGRAVQSTACVLGRNCQGRLAFI